MNIRMHLGSVIWDVVAILNLLLVFIRLVPASVVQLDDSNFKQLIESADFAFINFYADWCGFSKKLEPIFEEASDALKNETNVLFGGVNCERQTSLAKANGISKYPTLKYYLFGELSKREYRGSRLVEAMTEFVRKNLDPVFIRVVSKDELDLKLDKSKRVVLIYLPEESVSEVTDLRKIGAGLREDCNFYLGVGQNFSEQMKDGNTVAFRPAEGGPADELRLSGAVLKNFTYLKEWITDKCVPLVREITFENAEELTEEGLPFLILFRKPDDKDILDEFTKQVATQLISERANVNFLHADGYKFAHPLHHLGKSTSDLPLIAIDSFRHMYLFPDTKKLAQAGALKKFILDLHSGKLHREMHYGADPTEAPATDEQPSDEHTKKTTQPSSVFKKLKPSDSRYTILRDEL